MRLIKDVETGAMDFQVWAAAAFRTNCETRAGSGAPAGREKGQR